MRLRKSSALTLVTVLSAFVMLLTACGNSTTTGKGAAPDAKQVMSVGIIPAATDIRRMDPGKITDLYSYEGASPVFPGLLAYDDKYNVVPWAASALPTVTDGGLTYTFKIRPGLKWTDGTPITSKTFAYSWNRGLDPCTASGGSSYLYPIKGAADFNGGKCDAATGALNPVSSTSLIGKSIQTPDDQTLVVTLEKPYAYFTPTVAAVAIVLAQPQQLIEKYGIKSWTDHLTDNGGFGGNMYKVSVWDHKGNLTLVRNDDFWGTKPKLREIDFKIYKDNETAYAAYKNGQLDVFAGQPTSSTYLDMKSRKDFTEIPTLSTSYLQPNWKKAPFDDVRVRQAFSMAIDRQALAEKVGKGDVIPTYHIVPQGNPGYNPDLKGPDGTTSLTADVSKAKELITAYAADKCGGDITKCTPVTYTTSNTPGNVIGAQALLDMWKTAMPGYPITVSTVDFGTLIDQVYSGDAPQLVGIAWIVDYPDPQDWLSLQFLPDSSTNVGNVNIPADNDLMNQADVDQNQTSRFQTYNKVEQDMVTQGAWIVTNQQKDVWLYDHNKFTGFTQTTGGYTSLPSWQNNIYVNA